MTKRISLVLILLVFTIGLNAQNTVSNDSIFEVKVNFNIGDSSLYRFTLTSNSFESNNKNSKLKKSNELKFIIKDKTDSGYLVNAIFGKAWFEHSDSSSKLHIFNLLLKEKMCGLNLLYFINDKGTFVRWLNLESFRNDVVALFDSISSDDFLKYNKEFEPMVMILKDAYQSDKRIENEFLTPIKWFHYFYGAKLTLNKSESIEDEFNDLEFGIPVPAITQTQTEYSYNTDGNVLISGNSMINRDRYKNWLKSFKEETLASHKTNTQEIIFKTNGYDHKLTFKYKIEVKSGWIKQLSQRETIRNENSLNESMLEFTFLK